MVLNTYPMESVLGLLDSHCNNARRKNKMSGVKLAQSIKPPSLFRELVKKKAIGTLDCREAEMLDELQKQREIKAFKNRVTK